MKAGKLDISVIICAYTEKRWNDLLAAVEAVQRQSVSPAEIIVVIDHNPQLLARAKRRLPEVLILENQEPRGLSGARNSALAVASGAVMAFTDEDAVAAPDWLEQLSAGYQNPDVMGVGGAIEPLWQSQQPGWFPEEFNWVIGCTYRGMPEEAAPVRNLIGCNMSFRRQLFEAVGLFRNGIGRIGTYPVGCEETELCIRALQRLPHSVLLYQPRARVFHRVPASRANWKYFRDRCYAEGLSKALVTQLVGSKDGLAAERSYTLRTLPQGITTGITDFLLHRKPMGILRSGAIAAGFAITTAGYLAGRASQKQGTHKLYEQKAWFYD